jgi:predicted phage-related endonuclease
MATLVGKQFPDISVKAIDEMGDAYQLNVLKQAVENKKKVVLFWYPKDFTFVCPTEIHAFQEAAAEFEKRNNLKCYPMDMLKSKKYDFCLANIDSLITENGEVTAILECKTSGASSKDDWINGIIPVSYVYQVQWYMYITGIHKAYIAGLIGGQVYTQKEIIYDKNLVENILIPKAWNFWHKNVLAKKEPEIDGSQAAVNFIKNKYPTPTSKEICSLDTDYEKMIIKLKELKEKEKEIEEEINLYENKIKIAMGGGSKAETNNFYINWGIRKTTRVDTDRLKKDFLYDEYSKESEFRVFTIKEK